MAKKFSCRPCMKRFAHETDLKKHNESVHPNYAVRFDERDVQIARERLKETDEHSETLIQGAELEKRLAG